MSWPYVSTSFAPGPQRAEVGEHDPDFRHRPLGFTAQLDEPTEPDDSEPDLWEGDQA